MTKRLCTRCGRYFSDTLKACPSCDVRWWRRPINLPAFGVVLSVAGLWTLFCLVDGVRVWRKGPSILNERLGDSIDDPEIYYLALDTFHAALLEHRLWLWFAVTVVLLLVALIIKPTQTAP